MLWGFGGERYRSCLNAPRPYERCAISPLIVRDGAGNRFERHAFSAFAIAASWFAASVPVAVVLLVAAGALAVAAFSAACTFRATLLPVPSSALLQVRCFFLRRCSKGLTWGLQPGACALQIDAQLVGAPGVGKVVVVDQPNLSFGKATTDGLGSFVGPNRAAVFPRSESRPP
ncbi:MAG: hypothetical protein ACLUW6_01330 [Coriobacteriaceae bacterium]